MTALVKFDDTWLIRRLMDKVEMQPCSAAGLPDAGDCWVWTGAVNSKGYPMIRVGEKTMGAHVVSYRVFVGTPPVEWIIIRKCRCPLCVNPRHLEAISYDQAVKLRLAGRVPV